ncbi:MAG: 2TM domain-containing protein [Sphingobacteriaceae bacterium]|jgi:hypothetical protein|nr:2TM domain-containing protein [Sphingobacteriaceae bacterium]
MEMQTEKDQMLWKQAKKRVGFKNHLYTYLAVNIFMWVVWYFTDWKHETEGEEHGGIPWPIFSSLGWGFGLFWHFMGTYILDNKVSQVEKEYQKLKDKQK